MGGGLFIKQILCKILPNLKSFISISLFFKKLGHSAATAYSV